MQAVLLQAPGARGASSTPPVSATPPALLDSRTQRAVRTQERRAAIAAERARDEPERQQRIQNAMEARRASQVSGTPLTTSPERKLPSSTVDDSRPYWRVGDYVRVDSCTAPGINRSDGYGFVVAVRGVGADTEIDVRYVAGDGGYLHKGISIEEAVTASLGSTFGPTSLRQHPKRRKVGSIDRFRLAVETSTTSTRKPESAKTPQAALISELQLAASTNRGKGWRRKGGSYFEPQRRNAVNWASILARIRRITKSISIK